jgi:hypothetical protein
MPCHKHALLKCPQACESLWAAKPGKWLSTTAAAAAAAFKAYLYRHVEQETGMHCDGDRDIMLHEDAAGSTTNSSAVLFLQLTHLYSL